MDDMIERVAAAIEDADASFGYSIRLTSLVDDVATYTLKFADAPDDTFLLPSHAEASEMMAERRKFVRAKAVIEAMREPTEAMADAGGLAINPDDDVLSVTAHEARLAWTAMIAAALSPVETTPEEPHP